ncbi:hypothetical protein C2857_002590 [Epichloe festucae Fl1]|uniref:Uncharacterized protein n=1 Tax=Epichloe festucae (strain Fl1) TaxID=877507 RepID=A0A7S9KRU1_EPIFF|nr:hypothetical protein C2857_002590 [Epichloe festucae Fl1]
MGLAIPTPEGPYESIAFLGDRMDWPAWYDDVSAIAQALNVWKYVDPDAQNDVSEPVKPSMPSRPVLKSVVKREQFEADKTFDMRVEQERHAHALSVREYDILCEQYRIDAAEYLAQLAEYTSSKDQLQKLYRIIYRSIPDRYRAYLKLDEAKNPRAMILSLRDRIKPPSDRDLASAALRTYNSKVNVQPEDDKQAFIEAIALVTVELHRFQRGTFDEGTAVKDLLRSLQVLDEGFAETWARKGGKQTVLDIVEDFKYRLRRHGDGGLACEEQRDNSVTGVTTRREQQSVEEEPVSKSTSVNGSHSGHATFSESGSNAPSKPSGKKSKKGPGHDGAGVVVERFGRANKTGGDDLPPVEKSNKPKRRDVMDASSSADDVASSRKEISPPRSETFGHSKKDDDAPRADRFKKGGTNGAPASALPGDRHFSKAKKSYEPAKLVMRNCPGCEMRHLVRDDAWWENCYIYWELSGLGNIPDNFHAQERRLDLAFSRLQDCPDEMRRSEEWASSKNGRAKRRNSTSGSDNNHSPVIGTSRSESKSKSKSKGASSVTEPQAQSQSQTEEFNLW